MEITTKRAMEMSSYSDRDLFFNWRRSPFTMPASYFIRFLAPVFASFFLSTESNLLHGNEGLNISGAVTHQRKAVEYSSNWVGDDLWVGPDWWANPLYDWSRKGSAVVARALPGRSLCLLPFETNKKGSSFTVTVQIRLSGSKPGRALPSSVFGGLQFGRLGEVDDFRSSVINPRRGINAVVDNKGRLSLASETSSRAFSLQEGPIQLVLKCTRNAKDVEMILKGSQGTEIIYLNYSVSIDDIQGGLSLVSNGPKAARKRGKNLEFAFSSFQISGNLVTQYSDRSFGPIMWSQYTMDHGTVRLQAQLAPFTQSQEISLWLKRSFGIWEEKESVMSDILTRTATFTVRSQNRRANRKYEIRMLLDGKTHTWGGTIRREPSSRKNVKLGCFSCDNGYLFPQLNMVRQVRRQNPDMVFFAGDQIYESVGGFGVNQKAKTQFAMLDFLRKYYQFGWTWRKILRNRPSVILPDDHDVFQGNLWGHGGRQLPKSSESFDTGGYLMPGDWVAAVEKIHVGHLPKPAVDLTLPIGIKPYFTSITYGGLGFAVLEDRKFKTGPKSLPEREVNQGKKADLLGEEQEAFLDGWSKNWTRHSMKVALSQTMFCKATTHAGFDMSKENYFFDSGAWPGHARDRVVRILGDSNAFSIHGDQHLGILLQQGVQKYNDAGYAFMVPGTANKFPRAWLPGVKDGNSDQEGKELTGKFKDIAGNPLDVIAVGNPDPFSNLLPLTGNVEDTGYRKGSGYGIVEFDKKKKTAKVNLYRLGSREEQFEGFPKTVKIGGEPERELQ